MPWQQGPPTSQVLPPQGPPVFNGYETQTFESPPEDALWAEYCRRHPTILDGLERQYSVDTHDTYKVDFAIPSSQIAFEIDSFKHHNSNDAWARDRRRDLALSLRGWRVYRIDASTVLADPEGVINQFARIVTSLDVQQADLMAARAMERVATVLERIEARMAPPLELPEAKT
jgi:very-short-patch-repair endonuclease